MPCCKGDPSEKSDEGMDDIEKDRKCTDVLWVGLFGLFWVGMIAVVAPSDAQAIADAAAEGGIDAWTIGTIGAGAGVSYR